MTTATREHQWERLVKIPRGHKFFRDKLSGKVSVCDDSGARPHLTDDGPLWVQTDQPIVLQEQFESAQMIGSVPVIQDRTGEASSTLAGPREIMWLVRNLGMTIKIQTLNFGGPDDPVTKDDELHLVAGNFTQQFVPLGN